MAIRDVIRMGHPTLLMQAEEVKDPKSPEIRALLVDMFDTLEHQKGVGLAAPQIDVSKRVVIFFVPSDRAADREEAKQEIADEEAAGHEVPLTVLINPEIEPLSEEVDEAFEGCLSVPGLTGLVPRYTHIRYRGLDQNGQKIEREAKGFHARVVQHECDHLDGVLYPQRIEDMSYFGYTEEIRQSFLDEDSAGEEMDP
ncbi:MAG: peptide deformylase [Alphaproteobacteria bacterium RIFOXYD12_FULL_60_8]|nr:MAG: peptide deformylase [Alphaproteobacteria bacterium RIFOXYD12_FULL_60_8]